MEFVFDRLDNERIKTLRSQARQIAEEFCDETGIKRGQTVVIGCSTSEVLGKSFGTFSHPDAGEAIFGGLYSVFKERGIYIAAQCCEHLNRAIITESEAARDKEIVNVVPQPKAGGSFATAAYKTFEHPVALEEIKADGGIDIGGTLIGMHLKKVAVPVTLKTRFLGEAIVLCARTRPKYIGGERAVYNESLH